MPDRLSALDVSFLYLEEPTTPMHIGGVAILEPAAGQEFDEALLRELVAERIDRFPRYRQKIREVPGRLGNPVWVDDGAFDLAEHIRCCTLPEPGTPQQLRELVGRLNAAPLDRQRPLWELHLVRGLAGGRTAIVTKAHHAMVDGRSAMDVGALILDPRPVPQRRGVIAPWAPEPEPEDADLVADALREMTHRPAAAFDLTCAAARDVRATWDRATRTFDGVLSAVRATMRPAPASPLNASIGARRRYGMAATRLADVATIRARCGGTVNDAVLATVAGGLRTWLLARDEPLTSASTVRAMVPVNVRPSGIPGEGGNQISSYFVDLAIGEPDPVARLHRVSQAMRGVKDSGQSAGTDAVVALAGLAPPAVHAMAARFAQTMAHRVFNLAVTNVPGPQRPLYAAGARVRAVYPVAPLAKNQAVCIGVTSYDGGLFFGINADRDAMPDVDVLARGLEDAQAELLGACG
jgi:WS/DGAT/MGAT family acyltransferase